MPAERLPPGVTVVDHPVVGHRLAELRDRATGADRFRALVHQLAALVAYEALRDLATTPTEVSTPLAVAHCRTVTERLLVVPVLRAGLGMVGGIQEIVPGTEVAHLGLRRDESTLDAVVYLDGLPADLGGRRVVVCDPMLATGGSLARAVELVADRGPARVDAVCVLAAVPGLARFGAAHPDVAVTCAAVDAELDGRGYILPGLGDAGDRMFGPPP